MIDIEIDTINENPIDLPYGHNGKIYANIFLDDRAGLFQGMEILEQAMYQLIADKRSREKLDDVA